MADDEEGGVFEGKVGGDFLGAAENEVGHGGVDADGVAVVEGFAITDGGGSG